MAFSVLAGLLFSNVIDIAASNGDEFNEELLLKPLPTGHLYGHFQFTTIWNVTLTDKLACELFTFPFNDS